MQEMTAKQKQFVAEYLKDRNGTQAAIRCGYSEKSARPQASRLLTIANIKAAIEAATTKTAKKFEITKERIMRELARIGFADQGDYSSWDEEGNLTFTASKDLGPKTRAVQEISATTFKTKDGDKSTTVKLKLHDKKGALVELNRMLGYVVNKHEFVEVKSPEEATRRADELRRKREHAAKNNRA